MLDLPDGTVLYNDQGATRYYVYTPAGTPLAAGKPAISNITPLSCTTYRITGTLFNGISEGAAYGDDWQMASNYPIVRLTSGTNVYYARTSNWNSAGVLRGAALDTAQFDLPAGLPIGTYSLVVVANGISSNATSLTVSAPPNSWTGAVNGVWENPGNWSCNVVADANTDVIINSGTVTINSTTAICRTLTLSPGVIFTVNPGFKITIMH
jgi:hypothetical protein